MSIAKLKEVANALIAEQAQKVESEKAGKGIFDVHVAAIRQEIERIRGDRRFVSRDAILSLIEAAFDDMIPLEDVSGDLIRIPDGAEQIKTDRGDVWLWINRTSEKTRVRYIL